MTFCPLCDGFPESLGILGWTEHYRCNDCGYQWSVRRDPKDGTTDEKQPDLYES